MIRFLSLFFMITLTGNPLVAEPTAPSIVNFHHRAKAGDRLNVVFLGGSLTWGANASDPNLTSYRALMGKYLIDRYPEAHIINHDAAIGGTGSKLGLFRLQRDVFSKDPDLVFLDFTVNDGIGDDDTFSLQVYESLLSMLVERRIPVVIVQLCTFNQLGEKYDLDSVPRYEDHLKIATAYRTGVGDTLGYIQDRYERGLVDLDEVWSIGRDRIHPGDAGYRLYFEAVKLGYEQAVADERATIIPDEPVFGRQFMNPERQLLANMKQYPSGWQRVKTYRRSLWFDGLSSRWMGDVLAASSQKRDSTDPLTIEFKGTFVGLFGECNGESLPFRVYIDGQLIPNGKSEFWQRTTKRFSSSGYGNLFAWFKLTSDLSPGTHLLKIEPVFKDDMEPGELRIESICAVGPRN